MAQSRWSLLIGAIFVLSAGLAREYDGEDLLHEPWHMLRPLAASLASGTALFLMIQVVALVRHRPGEGEPPPFAKSYVTFLALFWMTAPMAWLYAIPYERVMTPVDAITLNLWTLALVACWRVLLITRVIQVVYGMGYISSFIFVMLFADVVVFVVAIVAAPSVIDVMGGIRHTGREAVIAQAACCMLNLSILSAPIWIVGAIVALCKTRPSWLDLTSNSESRGSRGLLVLACASVIAFVPLLVLSQPEQILRREAERLLEAGEFERAFAILSEREPSDYPPHWQPPPNIKRWMRSDDWIGMKSAMERSWPAEWVAQIFLWKIDHGLRLSLERSGWRSSDEWVDIIAELNRDITMLDDVSLVQGETAAFLAEHLKGLDEREREALAEFARRTSVADIADLDR